MLTTPLALDLIGAVPKNGDSKDQAGIACIGNGRLCRGVFLSRLI